MSAAVMSDAAVLLLLLCLTGTSHACQDNATSAYRFTGAACRLTYPAAVVLNAKTTKVIEAAFQHAHYPSVTGEKSIRFIGKVNYGLHNLEIRNLSIGQSEFELRPGKGIAMEISNVSAVFKGTVEYGYGGWLFTVAQSIDFEVQTQLDLGINPRLYCGGGKVAADTSDCYLSFHKLRLLLQGDKEPNWLKRVFTEFITLTVKLLVKGQICPEINKVANILADFIQDTAEQFLSDGDIRVDIGVTAAPVITANYIESYHKGLTIYKNVTAFINDSAFLPSQLTENRMLYFWIADQLMRPIVAAAHEDGRFHVNITGEELKALFNTSLVSPTPDFISTCMSESDNPKLSVWSSAVPRLNTSTLGTSVTASAAGLLYCGDQHAANFSFEAEVTAVIIATYMDKKLFLWGNSSEISILHANLSSASSEQLSDSQQEFVREAVEKVGIPEVLSVLQQELTKLLDKQGVYLFDIIDPEIIPQDGFVLIQMDFGFPHHLLVEFLKKTLEQGIEQDVQKVNV